MNPFQLLMMMRQSGNPQQFMLDMIQNQMGDSPMGKNLMNLAKSGDSKQIEQIARNIVGPNFDEQFSRFKNQLGL